jgi:hypothetical protein
MIIWESCLFVYRNRFQLYVGEERMWKSVVDGWYGGLVVCME